MELSGYSRGYFGDVNSVKPSKNPQDFPLKSFHNFTTMSLERNVIILASIKLKSAEEWIEHNVVYLFILNGSLRQTKKISEDHFTMCLKLF